MSIEFATAAAVQQTATSRRLTRVLVSATALPPAISHETRSADLSVGMEPASASRPGSLIPPLPASASQP